MDDKYKKYVIAGSSFLFYLYYDILATVHFFLVIAINYYYSEKMFQSKQKGLNTSADLKIILVLNLINLAFFKYFYFFLDSFFSLTHSQMFKDISSTVNIILPLAISFYTFQLIAIQVDIHKGRVLERISFMDYSIFIIFFPQLIAGPIMRTSDFLPRLNQPVITNDSMNQGIFLLLIGLFKKVVIADNVGALITPVYLNPESYHYTSIFLAFLGFAAQVYCDFSGYTDIARGLAYLLGFEIPENFKGPFYSASFTELWSRWHITLSTWLRDYLYIPLGGNAKGFNMSNIYMFITMVLGGFWHGANLSFIFWGAYLGILLWMERLLLKKGFDLIPKNPLLKFAKRVLIFILFAFSGSFFRTASFGADSLHAMYNLYSNFFGLNYGKGIGARDEVILYVFLTLVFNYFQYNTESFEKWKKFQKFIIPTASLIVFLLLGLFGDGGGDFIYFQF
jgi:alginate O-acetyltransferase complex protein AlgI